MIAIPLLLLSLSAGIFLLMKATREYLNGLFKAMAWLVILLSLLSLTAVCLHGVHHFRHMHRFGRHEFGMNRERQIIIKEFNDGISKDSVCPMGCCKMEGDSMVMDKGMCEKMMGKEACEKMCHERGRCIMSKTECSKMCGGDMKCCTDSKKPCCETKPACGGMKECCKKK